MSVILLTCAVVLTLMCSAYIWYEYSTYRKTLKANISTLAAIIASNSSGALAFDSQNDAIEILSALKEEPHILRACIYDNDSILFAKYPSHLPDSSFPTRPSATGFTFESKLLVGYQPVRQESKLLGTLYIVSDLTRMYDQLGNYAWIGILLIICSLIVAYILSKLLQNSISRPILQLKETAQFVSKNHDYSVRATKSGVDEVGALTDAFNQMLTRIENQNQEIKHFSNKLEKTVAQRTNELKVQKEFVEAIINASVDVIAVFDTECRFVTVNAKFEEIYRFRKDEVIGKKLSDILPQIKGQRAEEDLQRALKGEFIHNLYYQSIVNENTFESFLIPLRNENREVYSVVMMAHDITKIVEANEKLEMINSELMKSNRDLEQFAYVASHDLQEPLRKIQTFSQLLSQSYGDKEKLDRYHEKISQAAFRMQELIKDVLNFSRISNSEEGFEIVALDSILGNLKIDFELMLSEKKAVILYDKLPVVKGIPLQLTQLFSNLITNSLKYNDKNPVIKISWKKLSAEEVKNYSKLNSEGSYVLIKYEDNGIGFEPQFNERIFAIFQRLHSRQTYSGTGIGLAICRKIVENHGGLIFAEGKPGVGATFSIILPYYN